MPEFSCRIMLHLKNMQALRSLLWLCLPPSLPGLILEMPTGEQKEESPVTKCHCGLSTFSYMISSESHDNAERVHYCPHLAGEETGSNDHWPQVAPLPQRDSLFLQLLVLSYVSCSLCLYRLVFRKAWAQAVECSVERVLRGKLCT